MILDNCRRYGYIEVHLAPLQGRRAVTLPGGARDGSRGRMPRQLRSRAASARAPGRHYDRPSGDIRLTRWRPGAGNARSYVVPPGEVRRRSRAVAFGRCRKCRSGTPRGERAAIRARPHPHDAVHCTMRLSAFRFLAFRSFVRPFVRLCHPSLRAVRSLSLP